MTHSGAMTRKFSIPTEYNGTRFRSKLEADWARAFDALGIVWEYEPHGRYFGPDAFYLVDFYLPRSHQWVEVKGVFEPDDCRKIAALLEHIEPRPFTDPEVCPDIALIACTPGGHFTGWQRGVVDRHANLLELSRKASKEIRAFGCGLCGGWWFADDSLSWRCQCCGAAPGNAHVVADFGSPLPGFPNLFYIRPLGIHD